MIKVLLDRRGDEVRNIKVVVTAAAENKDSGTKVITLLLDR